jgi:DmsE family decaheme c-type cytochrome
MQIGRAVLRAAPVIALVCATAGLAGAVRVTATRAEAAPTPAQTAGSYVGQETCLTCHDGQDQTYAKTPHGRAADARTPAATQGCESCHGPGAEHAESGGDTSRIRRFGPGGASPAETTQTCATCHNRGEHALWKGSPHEGRDLTCTTCHSVHNPQSEAKQLKAEDQRALCATCHRDKMAKVDRSGHMPVREGKLQCTTCHNVHGTTNVRLLRKGNSVSELCTSCHAEKRGPYLWEHPPSRDGCTTCHDPHGSANERMLVSKPPILCQRCHVHTRHPATIYDAASVQTSARVFGRTCVNCHAAIHGSNHPSGQRFVR